MSYEYVSKISDWATLSLAIFATVTIYQSRQLHRDERLREDRITQRNLVQNIRQWSLEATHVAISRQTLERPELWSVKLKYKYSLAGGAYIKRIAEVSFPELVLFIENVIASLNDAIRALEFEANQPVNYIDIRNTEGQIQLSVDKLLKELASDKYQYFDKKSHPKKL